MTAPEVKVCCIASLDEARLALAAGARWLGLVSAMPSGPGVIPDARAAQIVHALPPREAGEMLISKARQRAATCWSGRNR